MEVPPLVSYAGEGLDSCKGKEVFGDLVSILAWEGAR